MSIDTDYDPASPAPDGEPHGSDQAPGEGDSACPAESKCKIDCGYEDWDKKGGESVSYPCSDMSTLVL